MRECVGDNLGHSKEILKKILNCTFLCHLYHYYFSPHNLLVCQELLNVNGNDNVGDSHDNQNYTLTVCIIRE